MSDSVMYIGYLEYEENGEVFVDIILATNPIIFTGEYHKITAAFGEGSCGNLFINLKKRFRRIERG